MKSMGEKILDARLSLGLSQKDVAEMVGVSVRMVKAYEQNEKHPRLATTFKLAKALKVSTKFLSDDACDNPMEDIEQDSYIEEAREQFGAKGARDIRQLLAQNESFLAGGSYSVEELDTFMNAMMQTYAACRVAAQEKFGKKTSGSDTSPQE